MCPNNNIKDIPVFSRTASKKTRGMPSHIPLRPSLRDSELTLDIALHDARVFLRGDLTEDGTVQDLPRGLAFSRGPERTSGPDAGTSLTSKKKTSLTTCSGTVRPLPDLFRQRAVQFGFCVSGKTVGAVISFRRALQAPASPDLPPERRPSDITRLPSSYLS